MFAGGTYSTKSGNKYYATVDIFDLSDGKWSKTNLSEARELFAAESANGKALFVGGTAITKQGVSYHSDFVDIFSSY